MSLRTIIREIRRSLTIWTPLSKPPRWVEKASAEIATKTAHDPFRNYHIRLKGKKHFYKVIAENTGQGNCKLKYYVKRRIK